MSDTFSEKLLSGNEAIAQGAWEAGVLFGMGYPGTPSTETLEYFRKLDGVYAEWAPNEKVALEVGLGVSMAGERALVTMKHVGVNVAADPLFTSAYTGVGGGLVILAADDPGMHSSQNEQDSRNYAAFARVPMLEPSDSAEAKRFAKLAFELSEEFDIPVMLRSTVRVSHSKSLVEVGARVPFQKKPYGKDPQKWVMMPAMAKKRRISLDGRVDALKLFARANTSDAPDAINRVEMRDTKMGVICSGVSYQYVREALPDASVLKLGLVFPFDVQSIHDFASNVDELYVIEEACDYLEEHVRAMGVDVADIALPKSGELSPEHIRCAFGDQVACAFVASTNLPARPPLLCAGCPHRAVFSELRRLRALVTGDIGCYTLAALPPLSSIDSCVDMGASISMAHGVELAGGGEEGRPVVAVIGDSTFAHSGITSLLNTVYNKGTGTVAILDNRTTAMTGHQGNPVNGITLQQESTSELDLEALAKALGVKRVRTVDARDLDAIKEALREETAEPELSVIIFKAPCALLTNERERAYEVVYDKCRSCGTCIRLGCPAISVEAGTGKALIDVAACVGCGQCFQVCTFGAIKPA